MSSLTHFQTMQHVLLLCFLTPINNNSEYLSSSSFKQTMRFLFSSFINFIDVSRCQTNTVKLPFLCNVGNLAPSALKKDGKVELCGVSFKTSLTNGILHECSWVVHNHSWERRTATASPYSFRSSSVPRRPMVISSVLLTLLFSHSLSYLVVNL